MRHPVVQPAAPCPSEPASAPAHPSEPVTAPAKATAVVVQPAPEAVAQSPAPPAMDQAKECGGAGPTAAAAGTAPHGLTPTGPEDSAVLGSDASDHPAHAAGKPSLEQLCTVVATCYLPV